MNDRGFRLSLVAHHASLLRVGGAIDYRGLIDRRVERIRLIYLRVVRAGLIATAELCSEQCLVCFLNEVERGVAVFGKCRDAEADRYMHGLSQIRRGSWECVSLHGRPDLLRHLQPRLAIPAHVCEVFFAAIACGEVCAAYHVTNDVPCFPDGVAADEVAAP